MKLLNVLKGYLSSRHRKRAKVLQALAEHQAGKAPALKLAKEKEATKK